MLAFSCILHIEPVAQDGVAEEVEASEVEVHEELQELEAAEQVEEQEFDLTNPDQQPGKHRFIYPRVFHKFKFGASTGSINPVSYISLNFSLTLFTCAFKLLGIV